jgi:hypothetical protein
MKIHKNNYKLYITTAFIIIGFILFYPRSTGAFVYDDYGNGYNVYGYGPNIINFYPNNYYNNDDSYNYNYNYNDYNYYSYGYNNYWQDPDGGALQSATQDYLGLNIKIRRGGVCDLNPRICGIPYPRVGRGR